MQVTKVEIAKIAMKLPRPWMDGGVTAAEWCEAVDIINAVSRVQCGDECPCPMHCARNGCTASIGVPPDERSPDAN